MDQLMPLPLTVSCFSKIQIGFTFLVTAHPGSPGKRAVSGKKQDKKASCSRLGGVLKYEFVANLPLSLPAKEVGNIW